MTSAIKNADLPTIPESKASRLEISSSMAIRSARRASTLLRPWAGPCGGTRRLCNRVRERRASRSQTGGSRHSDQWSADPRTFTRSTQPHPRPLMSPPNNYVLEVQATDGSKTTITFEAQDIGWYLTQPTLAAVSFSYAFARTKHRSNHRATEARSFGREPMRNRTEIQRPPFRNTKKRWLWRVASGTANTKPALSPASALRTKASHSTRMH